MRPRPVYQWIIHIAKGETRVLDQVEVDMLRRTLNEMLTFRHKLEPNMRVHSKKPITLIKELGTGLLLYERVDGNVCILFRVADETLQDDTAEQVHMTQYLIEQRCDNVLCPTHKKRLLPQEDSYTTCVHTDNPWYRSMQCLPTKTMYVCPEPDCGYAVCARCYDGGAIAGTVSSFIAMMEDVKKRGAVGAVGTIVVIVSGIVYLPVLKHAMMVIMCHPQYQCIFDRCWSDPNMMYVIGLLMSFNVVLFVGLGLIVVELWVLFKRRYALVPILPHRDIIRSFKMWCLPTQQVRKEYFMQFLKYDTSMLKSLYQPFEFAFLWFNPLQLAFKAGVVAALVMAEPNGLVQLACCSLVEVVYALALVLFRPFSNGWIEALARVGSLHQLVQLGLMCLHRVKVADEPTSIGHGDQMIAAAIVYIVCVVCILVGAFAGPHVARWWRRRNNYVDDEEMAATYKV